MVYAPDEKAVAAAAKIQVFQQETLSQGFVKADRRWEGTFLVWEPLRDGYGSRLALQVYHNGKLSASTPFPAAKLGLRADVKKHDGWPWGDPHWPAAPAAAGPG